MDVFIEREKRRETISFTGKASGLLLELEVNPQTVLIVRNKKLVTEDEVLEDTDSIDLITVVSGG